MAKLPEMDSYGEDRDQLQQLVQALNDALGPTLVAALAGATDKNVPLGWARPHGPKPEADARKRILGASEVWAVLEADEGKDVARRWFVGANPRLHDRSPVEAIRDGFLVEVRRAARSFVDDVVDE